MPSRDRIARHGGDVDGGVIKLWFDTAVGKSVLEKYGFAPWTNADEDFRASFAFQLLGEGGTLQRRRRFAPGMVWGRYCLPSATGLS